MSSVLTLADVLGRGVPVVWHEGVALVRGVAERLLETPGDVHAIPELGEIAISADGRVDFEGGTSTDEPVRRLGQLLQATLMGSELPVQLRLVISQATAPAPRFGSIREYNETLAYFERPDRDAVLRGLYTRALKAPPVADSKPNPAQTADTIAPLPTSDRPEKAPIRATPTSKKPRTARLVAGGMLLLLVCGAGVWYVRIGRGTTGRRDVSAIALRASDAVGAAVVSGLSAVTERVGLGRLVSPDAESSPPAAAPPATASEVKRAAPLRTNGQMPTFRAFDLEPIAAARIPGGRSTVSPLPTLPPSSERLEETGDRDPEIYSPGSAGVVPPVGVRPQLPKELPSEVNQNDLGRIELLILSDGTVGSVRLLGAPRNVHDSMFLSAAKAWQFQPALKDGVPVRYRKVIWIAHQ